LSVQNVFLNHLFQIASVWRLNWSILIYCLIKAKRLFQFMWFLHENPLSSLIFTLFYLLINDYIAHAESSDTTKLRSIFVHFVPLIIVVSIVNSWLIMLLGFLILLDELPYLNVPLHTVIKLSPIAYGCRSEHIPFDIKAVDTHRPRPPVSKIRYCQVKQYS